MSAKHRRKGMTLIEMVVTVLILTMAAAAFLAMSISSLRGWSSGTSKETSNSQVTIATQKLANEIRDARTATVSTDKKTLTVTFPRLLTDPTTHEQIYDLSANDPTPRSYYISNGNLVRNAGGQITILARGVTAAEFGASGGTVSITLTSSEQVGTYQSSDQVTSRITLRNYRS